MTSRKNTILEGLQIILEDLHLDITELVDTEWDAAIISDGSGTTLDKPVGWASILLLKNSNEYFLPNCGSMSFGTNNLAELLAVVQPLLFLSEHFSPVLEKFKVIIISDSRYVVDGINKPFSLFNNSHSKHRELWAAIEMARRQGFDIEAKHINKSTSKLNIYAHMLANLARTIHSKDLNKGALNELVKRASAAKTKSSKKEAERSEPEEQTNNNSP